MARGLRTIHNRLFLLFLVCMLSLLFLLSFLYYQRTTDQFHAKIGDIAQKNVSQTVNNFDLLLKGYDSLTKSVSGNLDLQRLLTQPNQDAAVRTINDRTITNILGTIFYSREDMVGIHVMSYTGSIYSYENYVYTIDEHYMQRDWFRRIRESTGELVWLGVHEDSLIDPTLKRPVFSFGRQVYDLTSHQPIGEVLIEVDPNMIMSGLSNMLLGAHSEAYIVDQGENDSVVASTTASSLLPDALKGFQAPKEDGQVIVDQQPDRLVVSAKPALADWSVVSVTPFQDLNVELNQTKHFLAIVVSALVVLSTALATFVSRTISSPLKRLIHGMKQVERGDFRGTLNVKSYEEINILVASFNQMVNRMDDLIERVKASSISEKNAQLQALQAQINPHFLYNTLDMIYWMLDEKENDRLGRVVLALSHMFRYSSQWENGSEVALREELQQIRHYVTVIQTRLEGRFSVDFEIEEKWLDTPLPKMTLQPIIENAVKYGLESLLRPGELTVRTEEAEEGLHIVIEDNGTGMEPAALRQLEASLGEAAASAEAGTAAGTATRRGIGLQNVQRRLALMFGSSYGLRISSKPDEGTVVIVFVPLPAKYQGGRAVEHPDR